MTAGIWLITGAQASGKSTVAELLAREFEPSVHVRGGQFHRWAVRGWVHAGDADRPAEARRLLDLPGEPVADVERWLGSIAARPRHLVVLRPTVAVVEARDAARREGSGKVAYRAGFTPSENDAHLATTPRKLGLWLDTSAQTPEATVRAILARSSEARIG